MDNAQVEALEQLRRGVHARIAARDDGQPPSAEATKEPARSEQAQEAAGQGLEIDWSTEPPPAYANGLQLACASQEFSLVFTDMVRFPGRLAVGNKSGAERARVSASLRVNPDVFFQMLCVMTSSWNRFITEAADSRMRQPKFKLLDAGDAQLEGLSEKQRGEA